LYSGNTIDIVINYIEVINSSY